MDKLLICILVFSFFQLQGFNENIPEEKPQTEISSDKENLWVFIMAGQSNMAGRGVIESQDSVTNSRILSIDKNNKWVIATEPLHFYENGGLDCGMSFANELLKQVPDSITIVMVPCAVGGSSVFQWLQDDEHRGVKLLSNFKSKVELAKNKGIIKGILWHQGERNANSEDIHRYKNGVLELFSIFRQSVNNNELPILVGEIGRFAEPEDKNERFNQINQIINQLTSEEKDCYLISSKGLTDKGDKLHFDSRSQRELGKRFAQKYYEEKLLNKN